ncbi:MAG: hypothetical protein KAR47_13225 [Planctomycetes bacterium]|nr:hypothetical protein [Planctomycetota bacterium]
MIFEDGPGGGEMGWPVAGIDEGWIMTGDVCIVFGTCVTSIRMRLRSLDTTRP